MEKHILSKLVSEGKTLRAIAKTLDCTERKVGYWLAKFSLVVTRKQCCKKCGENRPEFFQRGRYTKCKHCRNVRERDRKQDAIAYKGGKCEKCGYCKCPGALDFHHLDPKEKDASWNKMRHWQLKKIKHELDKCQLLCKNCHAEVHYNGD